MIQVCISTGEAKKGRGNIFGIYKISRMTFMANYLAMSYAIPCGIAEYKKNFNRVLKLLS